MVHLYQKLEEYSNTDFYPFHMPGHKRNQESTYGNFPLAQDITEIDGFDNLHHAEEILLQAQKNVAELYGVKESFFSVNGSTAGLLSAISAAVKKNGKLLTARNCHKAVYHAMYLRDIHPVYIYPPMETKYGINGGISPENVEKCLMEDPEIQAVLLTSPTYDGVVSDVRAIAELAHQYGVPLIVDEAHGAHFTFHTYFPVSAAEFGADIVIQSFHKTLPSMTQTAVLHRCTDLVSREKIARFMGIYQSSSPSYILMASMDACMEKLKKNGKEMYEQYTRDLQEARESLKKCRNLKLVTEEIKGKNAIFDYDRSKILISTIGTELNGNTLSELLRREYHLEMEMAAENYVTALTSVGDRKEGFERLCKALLEIDGKLDKGSEIQNKRELLEPLYIPLEQKMLISDAMDAESESCPLEKSAGRISGEFAYFYPPGIPVITPGEKITEQLLKSIKKYRREGFVLQGLTDYQGEKIQVVLE